MKAMCDCGKPATELLIDYRLSGPDQVQQVCEDCYRQAGRAEPPEQAYYLANGHGESLHRVPYGQYRAAGNG